MLFSVDRSCSLLKAPIRLEYDNMSATQAAISYPVYLGIWTNWSLGGRVKGSTITLTHRDGALLTAFLAVFITFAGSRLWRVLCFISCQLLSQPDTSQDGLYHQRQAVLQNATNEGTGALKLFQILSTWRQEAYRPFRRMIPFIGLSLLISTAVTLSSIFSSRISSTMKNEVLISSPNCGIANPLAANITGEQYHKIFRPWQTERMNSYANYVQRCYSSFAGTGNMRRDDCTPFVKRELSTKVDQNATCPFGKNICRNQNGNIRIDSGYLHSQDLGLNLPIDLQFILRKLLQCAPLNTNDYKKVSFYSEDKPYVQYFYGPRIVLRHTNNSYPYTYEVEQLSADELAWRHFNYPDEDYRIQ